MIGAVGAGLLFNGTDQYASTTGSAESPLEITSTLTMSAWIYPTSLH
jgi:hypothetical protein